jgi:transcriptional regulator with XRE-family HTH domain
MSDNLAFAIGLVNSISEFIICYDSGDNQSMPDKRPIRLRNLRFLVEQTESIADFARKYLLDPTYISQLLNGHRSIGEKAARNLELKIGLEPDWLDREPGKEHKPISSPEVLLTPRERAMVGLFQGLTEAQQDEVMRHIQKQEQKNREVLEQLSHRQRQGKRGG